MQQRKKFRKPRCVIGGKFKKKEARPTGDDVAIAGENTARSPRGIRSHGVRSRRGADRRTIGQMPERNVGDASLVDKLPPGAHEVAYEAAVRGKPDFPVDVPVS
jgi:hypothetical protein